MPADLPATACAAATPAGVAGARAEAGVTARRFGGVQRLIGTEGFARLAAAHVAVIGIGGVGSWAVEALARSGVGALTLVDMDHVAESNINRQIHALDDTLGASKGEAMARRIAGIQPGCRVVLVDDFVTPDNAADRIPADAIVIDAIDQPRVKAAMAALCRTRGQRLIMCGGAGAVIDPLTLRRGDLCATRGDPLLASVRARLRREHGFPREAGRRFGVAALWFDGHRPAAGRGTTEAAGTGADAAPGAPLACAGYGSLVTVTATLGMAAAAAAIDWARGA